jgi:hypothetical protein
VRAAEQGVGLYEMKHNLVDQDLADWQPMLAWLRQKEDLRHLAEGINPLPVPA